MSNKDKSKQLEEQIDLRIELIQKAIGGELKGEVVPSSLTAIRNWEDSKLGVKKIGSPTSFVKTHKVYGRKIRKIHELVGELYKPKPKQKSLTKRHVSVIKENARLKRLLQTTTNQFVQYSTEKKKLKNEITLSKSLDAGLNEQIEEMEQELSDVKAELLRTRKRLIKCEGGLKSKVATVDFSKRD